MLIEYLGSFFSPYWGWDVPWEALIKVTETHTLWKHSLFIVAISFCSNTLTHYRAFLYRTIDPFLVSHYRTGGGGINSLKFNTFSPPAWISRKGGGGGAAASAFRQQLETEQISVHFWWRETQFSKLLCWSFHLSCVGGSLLFLPILSLWYFHSVTISFKSPFMSHS